MKNIQLYIALFLFSSCSSFIDVTPLSDNSVENFYKTEQEIDQAVVAVYDGVQTLVRPAYLDLFGEITSDNSYNFATTPNGGANANFDNFNLATNNIYLNRFWTASYAAVQRANIVLSRMEGVTIPEEKKNQRKGEALFLRSLVYFYLVQIWGDVPLILDETKNPISHIEKVRDKKAEILTQIIADLKIAEALLPLSYAAADQGRATKGATQALLARIYLHTKEYTNVVEYADKVIHSNLYQLDTDYETFFDTRKVSQENIFVINFKSGTNSEGYPFSNVNHDYDNTASYDLMNYYKNDPRLNFNVAPTAINTFYSKKIHNTLVNNDNTINVRIIILRYADVLLMKAEALNNLSYPATDALQLMNTVRKRSGLNELMFTDLASKEQFQDKLMDERRIEFAFENLRWFDLVRTGMATQVMSVKNFGGQRENSASGLPYTFKDSFLLFPVPQAQIDASAGRLSQNLGY